MGSTFLLWDGIILVLVISVGGDLTIKFPYRRQSERSKEISVAKGCSADPIPAPQT